MMTTVTVPVEALNDLIGERKRYEAWIRALDEKAGSAPAHILERVRGDYTTRLEQVVERLAEHAAELQGAIQELEGNVAAASEAVREREEARLEGELRASVGEYGDDKWEELRDRLDAELAGLIQERDTLQGELGELREIFTQATPTAPGSAASMEESGVEVRPTPVPAAGLADAAPVEHAGPGAVPDGRIPDASIAAPESASMLNDLRATGAAHRSGSEPGRRGGGATDGRAQPGSAGAASAADDPLGELGYLAPSPGAAAVGAESGSAGESVTEAAKSLRCQECHAMNYPTEWYCERCGGELATL